MVESRAMKRLLAALLVTPSLLLAAATENETVVWKECSPELRAHVIRAFMEIATRDDLVVYSTTPGKLTGVCGRARIPEIRAKLAARAAGGARKDAKKTKRKDGGAAEENVFSFSLAEMLDPDREIWLVRRLVAVGRDGEGDLEDGTDAVVFFGGTEKQGALVVGQRLRGVIVPNGVYTVTNDYRRDTFDDEGWERRHHVERLRLFKWRADRPEEDAEATEEDAAGEGRPAAPSVYLRTFGINYLNAEHIFPLWLRARGGSFRTTVRTQRTCDRCGGKGKWTEWRGTGQKTVSCPVCGGVGSVEVLRQYTIVPEGPNARKKVPFR